MVASPLACHGLIGYDLAMMSTAYTYDPIEQRHSLDGHPEHRDRLDRTLHQLP